ncbi:MAG: hypothetical protein ACRDK7_10730, partial [Solirubrobacteraceae bacterium]
MAFRTTSEPPVAGTPGELFNSDTSSDTTGEDAQAGAAGDNEASQAAEDTLQIAGGLTATQWLQIAQRSYDASSSWYEASIQRPIARNYAHFQSRHAPGSKYLTEYYRLRSQTFRPKTRAMVLRQEAALAVALFSTADLLDTSPWDDTDPDQQDAAEVNKALLQYRMERTLLWYQTLM